MPWLQQWTLRNTIYSDILTVFILTQPTLRVHSTLNLLDKLAPKLRDSLQVQLELNITSWARLHKCAAASCHFIRQLMRMQTFFVFFFLRKLMFWGQLQQLSAKTPPVSSTGVWRLAALSATVCLHVPVSTHTHTNAIAQRGPCSWWQAAPLSLLPACSTHSSLSNSYLYWFPPLPPNLDMHSLKNRPTAEFGA